MMAEYPKELTKELRQLLGLMIFQTGPIAGVLREGGEPIPNKCVDEQAFVLHWMINLYLEHGSGWREKVAERLQAIAAKAAPTEVT